MFEIDCCALFIMVTGEKPHCVRQQGTARVRALTHGPLGGEGFKPPLVHFFTLRFRTYFWTKLLGNAFLIRGKKELKLLLILLPEVGGDSASQGLFPLGGFPVLGRPSQTQIQLGEGGSGLGDSAAGLKGKVFWGFLKVLLFNTGLVTPRGLREGCDLDLLV